MPADAHAGSLEQSDLLLFAVLAFELPMEHPAVSTGFAWYSGKVLVGDHDFHHVAEAVRKVIRRPDPTEASPAPSGTILVVSESMKQSLFKELWQNDLDCIHIGDGTSMTSDGRTLEILLGYLLAQTCSARHLQDPDYASLLTEEEQALKNAIVQFQRTLPNGSRSSSAWPIIANALTSLCSQKA